MAYLDQREITHFLAQELFQQFMTLDGIHSGVPTRTTPTVTPTTLRSIEQTFIELQKSEPHANEAGFVPPLVHAIGNNQYVSASDASDIYTTSKSSSQPLQSSNTNLWPSNLSQSSFSDCDTRSTPPLSLSSSGGACGASTFGSTTTQHQQPSSRRNMGGRKPTKDANISPEEEERRRVRRERNKAAAARCRKRRVDHTNQLAMEVDELERKRHDLQEEIQRVREEEEDLEILLKQHLANGKCRRKNSSPPDIKPFEMYGQLPQHERVKTEMLVDHHQHHQHHNQPPLNTADLFLSPPQRKVMFSTAPQKPNRPNSLNVAQAVAKHHDLSELTGIPINTPSTGMIFNFESLMGGGTGLTPVSGPLVPSCSTQQRNIPTSMADLSSPDASTLVSL